MPAETLDEIHERLGRIMAEREAELIGLHARLVQVPSVNRGDGSSARETEVAGIAGDYLERHGAKVRIPESAPGRGNLLATVESTGKAASGGGQTLLLMGHSDVVPAGDESSWRFPPFSARQADGRIWGRGANDCKMLVASELFSAACLADLGLPRAGTLRLAIGADEEAGGRWGFGWLAENEADFLRADLAINEGGGASLGAAADGQRLVSVGCGEKGRFEIKLTARAPGGHASVPWGKSNPVARIGELAERIARWQAPAAPASPIFENLRESLGLAGAITEGNLSETIDCGLSFSNAFANSLRAQSRMTIVPTGLLAGEKSNAIPATATLVCDGRTLPGQTRKDLESALKNLMKGFDDIEVAVETTAEPSGSAFGPEIRELFERALAHTFAAGPAESEFRTVPSWCTGFTDSRFARGVGTPTYGFQLIKPGADPDQLSIHCIDESIETDMLLPCAQSLAHFALDFCEGSQGERGSSH